MAATEAELAHIAGIAALHRGRPGEGEHPWSGRTLRELLALTGYREVRPRLREEQLEEWLRPRRKVQEEWLAWCDDKRTSGGFYVSPSRRPRRWVIGSVGASETTEYESRTAAVAAYILRELDYWAARSTVDPLPRRRRP